MVNVNERIKQKRLALDIKQDELATRTELCQSYISEIEKNKKIPSIKTLTRIAQAFNCSITELLHDDDIE